MATVAMQSVGESQDSFWTLLCLSGWSPAVKSNPSPRPPLMTRNAALSLASPRPLSALRSSPRSPKGQRRQGLLERCPQGPRCSTKMQSSHHSDSPGLGSALENGQELVRALISEALLGGHGLESCSGPRPAGRSPPALPPGGCPVFTGTQPPAKQRVETLTSSRIRGMSGGSQPA